MVMAWALRRCMTSRMATYMAPESSRSWRFG